MQSNNHVTIYGCGGAGVEILSKIMVTDLSDFAIVHDAYVDGSRSNTDRVRPTDANKWYFLEGVDGAGKIRASNHEVTDRSISDILNKLKPSDLNILIFSASGGSGSVIGPKLADELWRQGKTVLLYVVGSTESARTCENTLKTLASLQNLAVRNNVFGDMYFENNESNTRNQQVDISIVDGVRAVCDLFSGFHRGLDSADVLTWANPVKSVNAKPQLALLDISTDRMIAESISDPYSVAELYGDNKTNLGTIPADYSTYGDRSVTGRPSLYFTIYSNGMEKLISELNSRIADYEQRRVARERKTTSLAIDPNDVSGDGMVL